jgi:hypothetical protein
MEYFKTGGMKSAQKMSLTILLLILTFLASFPVKSASTPIMYVEPETYYTPDIGQTFTINISVADVTDLWGWVFKLYYTSIHLNGTALEEGPFLKTAGETFFWEVNFTDNYNATHGFVYAFCHLTHVIPGANGNGTIAIITFKSMAHGASVLHLTETKLKNSAGDYISHETVDGTVIIGKLGDLGGGLPPQFFAFDGEVNGLDAALFRMCYLGQGPILLGDLGGGVPPQFFAFDGEVNGLDAALFRMCYLGQGPDP